jgi:DNA-binding IclR family transcriptional regulator
MHRQPTGALPVRSPRSLELVELLAFAELTAPQAAGALGIHPRTARRHLRTLSDAGWVAGHPGTVQTFTAGMRLLAASWHMLANHPIVRRATPVLGSLGSERALVELAVPSYDVVLALSRTAAGGWHARALPPHASAAGKLLLAYRDDWRRARLSEPLERYTPATVTDPGKLDQELAETRARGYALELGEHAPGSYACAVPFTSSIDPGLLSAVSIGAGDACP